MYQRRLLLTAAGIAPGQQAIYPDAMKTCSQCQTANPGSARYCMACGYMLPAQYDAGQEAPRKIPGISSLGISLLASLALSLVLMLVFRLPIFIIAGFLPLFWQMRKRKK